MVLGHAAADDEQLRPHQLLELAVVHLQPGGPALPVEVRALLGGVRGAALEVTAAGDVHVAELGVRDEDAVVDKGRADPRAERGHDDETAHVLGRAVAGLGVAGGVRVVDERDLEAQALLEQLLGLEADPGRGHVGRRHGRAVHDRGGEAHAERRARGDLAERVDDLLHGGHDVLGLAALRRRQLHALALQLAGRDVHDGALDAGPADVDADCGRRVLAHGSDPTGSPDPVRPSRAVRTGLASAA